VVELAARLGRGVRVTAACCSIAVGEEVIALDDAGDGAGLQLDLEQVLEHERRSRAATLGGIKVVRQTGCCGA
jgi:hypothetical protein